MLSFMNSKLTKMTGKSKQNHIFQNRNPMKYPVQLYIWVRARNLLFMYFTGVSYQTLKSILNVIKKTSNLIKGICSHKICSRSKSQPVKKTICHSVPKTFDFSQNYSVPFHQVTFNHSISCVLLIDKPNKSCQNSKNLKEMPYPPQKRF